MDGLKSVFLATNRATTIIATLLCSPPSSSLYGAASQSSAVPNSSISNLTEEEIDAMIERKRQEALRRLQERRLQSGVRNPYLKK